MDVSEFNEANDLSMAPELRVLDLVSETGELSKELLKNRDYGEESLDPDEAVANEFGDVYYSLLSLADELGVDPETALANSVEKYRARLGERGDAGSGE